MSSDDPYEYDYDSGPAATAPGTTFGLILLGVVAVLTVFVFIGVAVRKHNASKPPAVAQQERRDEPAPQRPAEPRARAMPVSEDGWRYDRDSAAERLVDTFMIWMIVLVFFSILYIVLVILLMAWVAKDCRNRGIDGGAVWVLVVFLTGVIGLLVYLASRPHGMLTVCTHCNNHRLSYARICPHCGRK